MRLSALLFTAYALSACAPSGVVYQSAYQSQLENLRTKSLDVVKAMALSTQPYFEKNGQKKTVAAAQDRVRASLKDPDSAKFQDLRVVDYAGGKVVCGEVNAKNSYGGYVGYKQFAAGIWNAEIYDADSRYSDITTASNAGIEAACSYR
jgi:hypothetical protein